MNTQCLYCSRTGVFRASKNESPDLTEDIYVCSACWSLLQNPATALPLIRGHLSITIGRRMPEKAFKKTLEQFMGTISKFKPSN